MDFYPLELDYIAKDHKRRKEQIKKEKMKEVFSNRDRKKHIK